MRIILTTLVVICLMNTPVANAGITADGATVEKLADSFKFTEGPACDAEGNVYFTDQPNDRIMLWSVKDELSTYMEPCGRSNGLCFDKEGGLWACADEKNELWRIAPDKTHTVILSTYEGKILNAPNDLWIAPNGGLYFSDPFYKRDYWTRGPSEQSCEGVYYVAKGSKEAVRVVDDLKQPNGLIGTTDGKTLYVADIGDNKTYKYTINADATLSGRTLFCEKGSDGMTIDSEGNVYLTGDGVIVFDPKGKQIEHIKVDAPWTANVCFGGADRKSLFITASTGLYRLKMSVKGVNSQ